MIITLNSFLMTLVIYSWDGKAEFSASLLLGYMILQKSFSDMLIFCSRNISYYY